MSFHDRNSMLSDPQLQSAVNVPHFPDTRCPFSPIAGRVERDTGMTTIRFEQDQGVGTIVLANPPQNRIGSQFAEDLRVAVHEASLSDSRVLAIRSEGPNFCLGGNVPEWIGKSADWFRTFIAECNSSFHAIEALRIPTVAVVRGGAIGGGMELAPRLRLSRRGGECEIFRRRDSWGQHSVGGRAAAARGAGRPHPRPQARSAG